MTRHRRGLRLPATTFALLLALCAAALPAWAASPLKPFTATYDVNYMGLNGTATMALAPAGEDRWKYSLDIDSAIANLSQHTVFDARGGQWRPLSNNDSAVLLIKRNSKRASGFPGSIPLYANYGLPTVNPPLPPELDTTNHGGGEQRPATKVARVDDDKQQILWIVPGLPVPARILQRKGGKDEMDLVLTSIE